MRFVPLVLAGVLVLPCEAPARVPAELHADYATYAAGLHVAAVHADIMLDPYQYQVQLGYHTTGVVGFFDHREQRNAVNGVWHAGLPQPRAYTGSGIWGGEKRETVIDYRDGDPVVRALLPPDAGRQPVPLALQQHSVDTLSALALLMRLVDRTRRCDASVRTYDGRRVAELTARTVGWERLPRTDRSSFAGPALRCDFTSRVLAGFRTGRKDEPPLHGSAWFATVVPGEPALPVELQLDTAWFGEATTYLTAAGAGQPPEVAQRP